MATNGTMLDGGYDDGRSFSERRRAAVKNLERCSFEGPPSADHDDGYTTSTYFKAFQKDSKSLHASGNSSGALNELADPEPERESTVKRPPSLDYKPRRSESDAPTGLITVTKTAEGPNGTTASTTATYKDLKDVDGYKSTTYYAANAKNESGYGMTGMNTSSSIGDIQAMDKE